METKERMSPREWFENIWYHYKWVIIIGGVVVLFLIVSLGQLFSNSEPDVNILHVGPMYISVDAAEDIEKTVATLSDDYNGDGEINTYLLDITINKVSDDASDPAVQQYNSEGYTRFQTEIRAGDAIIYFLRQEYFDICVQEGILTFFEDIIDDAYMPENVIEGCGVKFSELDASKLPGFSAIPENAILCIRQSPNDDEINYGRTEEEWQGNKRTFINIIKYKGE